MKCLIAITIASIGAVYSPSAPAADKYRVGAGSFSVVRRG